MRPRNQIFQMLFYSAGVNVLGFGSPSEMFFFFMFLFLGNGVLEVFP